MIGCMVVLGDLYMNFLFQSDIYLASVHEVLWTKLQGELPRWETFSVKSLYRLVMLRCKAGNC